MTTAPVLAPSATGSLRRMPARASAVATPSTGNPVIVTTAQTPFWAWAERWRDEIATTAGLLFLVEALLLPALALPFAVAGVAAVALPLGARVRGRTLIDDLHRRDEASRRERVTVDAALRSRLEVLVRDVALEAGLGRQDVRLYQRGATGFVRGGTDAEAPLEHDRTVLASAWASGIARQPRTGTPDRPYSTLLASRVDDHRSGGPLGVVVLDVPGAHATQDSSVRRVRTTPAWARLVGFLEIAAVVSPARSR